MQAQNAVGLGARSTAVSVTPAGTAPTPTVNISASPSGFGFESFGGHTLTYSGTNLPSGTTCTASGLGWTGSKSISTTPITENVGTPGVVNRGDPSYLTRSYTLTCAGTTGTATVTVCPRENTSWNGTACVQGTKEVVLLAYNDVRFGGSSVSYGGNLKIKWYTKNMSPNTTCVASSGTLKDTWYHSSIVTDRWVGPKANSGEETISGIYQIYDLVGYRTIGITCTEPNNGSVITKDVSFSICSRSFPIGLPDPRPCVVGSIGGSSNLAQSTPQSGLVLGASTSNVSFTGLTRGSSDNRVSSLKTILRTISPSVSVGCRNLSVTNTLYGPTTEECVKIFQNLNELEPTGSIDQATNRALNRVLAN
jgi:hypothetical protein